MTNQYTLPNGAEMKTGDVFCCTGSMKFVSAAIRIIEKFQSKDNEAIYGHSGIVANDSGLILDTLWRVQWNRLDEYRGQQVLVARPTTTPSGYKITEETKKAALDAIAKEGLGRMYPAYRFILHLLKPVAKYVSTGKYLVCSERTAKYLAAIAARGEVYAGINPDDLADEWRRWKNFDVIYEGPL